MVEGTCFKFILATSGFHLFYYRYIPFLSLLFPLPRFKRRVIQVGKVRDTHAFPGTNTQQSHTRTQLNTATGGARNLPFVIISPLPFLSLPILCVPLPHYLYFQVFPLPSSLRKYSFLKTAAEGCYRHLRECVTKDQKRSVV